MCLKCKNIKCTCKSKPDHTIVTKKKNYLQKLYINNRKKIIQYSNKINNSKIQKYERGKKYKCINIKKPQNISENKNDIIQNNSECIPLCKPEYVMPISTVECCISNDDLCKKFNNSVDIIKKINMCINNIFCYQCEIKTLILESFCSCNFNNMMHMINIYIDHIEKNYEYIATNIINGHYIFDLCCCIKKYMLEQKSLVSDFLDLTISDITHSCIYKHKKILDCNNPYDALHIIDSCICVIKQTFSIICEYIKYLQNISVHCDMYACE